MAFTYSATGYTDARRLGLLAAAAMAAGTACNRAPPAPALDPDPARLLQGLLATCARAVRDVQVRRAGESGWEPAAVGTVFRPGDAVRTGPLSTARIAFLAGGELELEESTDLLVDAAAVPRAGGAAGGEGRVVLKAGVARGSLPQAAPGRGQVGLVVAAADGSELRVAPGRGERAAFRLASRERGTELAILEGAATVSGPSGEVLLTAGHLALVRGGDLGDSAELIGFPRLLEPGIDARFQFSAGTDVRLAWKEVRGATGYRIQLARDLSFQDVEVSGFVPGAEYLFRPAAPGMRAWRVAARDAAGRFGEYGFARRIHWEEQAPRELLVGPADGVTLQAAAGVTRVAFSWESAGEARSYLLVLAAGPDLLARKVTSLVVPGQRAALEIARPGDYWWGVYVDSEADPRPLFTSPRRLSLRRETKAMADVPRAISRWGE